MYDTKLQIFNIFTNDVTLMNMLASNVMFNHSGNLSKKNSVVPFNQVRDDIQCPFITVQGGGESKTGSNLLVEDIYIRAYNSTDKSFETIRKILARIKELLDNTQLSLAEGVNVVVRYNSSLNEAEDEAVHLNFRESRYQAENL